MKPKNQAKAIKMSERYLNSLSSLIAEDSEGPVELGFIKTTFTLEGGSVYLLQVQHISGPMIILEPKGLAAPSCA